jgi:hypothetical protein
MVMEGDKRMARTRKQTKTQPPTPGFAIELKPDTDLGMAMLIAEDEECHYEPVAVASTINEAKEIAASDLRRRMRELERGGGPGICPWIYKVWAHGIDGSYRIAAEFDAETL